MSQTVSSQKPRRFKQRLTRFLSVTTTLITLTATTSAQVSAQVANVCQPRTVVYYLNGIMNASLGEVADGASLIKFAVGATSSQGKPVEYAAMYNPFSGTYNASNGLACDLIEVYQVLIMTDPEFVELRNFVAPIAFALSVGLAAFIVNRFPFVSRFIPRLVQKATERVGSCVNQNATTVLVDQFTSLVRDGLRSGNRIVIVSHSQGNTLANAIHNAINIPQKSSLSIYGVAVPTSNIAGRSTSSTSSYVTYNEDKVILLTSSFSLPSNTALGNPADPDLARHSFSKSYMASGANGRPLIVNAVTNALNTLPFPTRDFAEGAITVRLSWDSQPDVDLHVFEPNGTHVYYGDKSGVSGTLDVDDTTGFGPENYFVACGNEEVGTYRVGLNYYRGSAPTSTVTRAVIGPTQLQKQVNKVLPSERGPNGNNSPVPIMSIIVGRNPITNALTYNYGN